MGNKPLDERMEALECAFEENALKAYEAGETEVFMLHRYTCSICQQQFDKFAFDMGFTAGKKSAENKMLAKIYPVEIATEFGARLISESRAWKREMKDSDLEIKYTPTFLDARTHQIIAYGLQEKDFIADMLTPETVKKRRAEFLEGVESRGKEGCDAVACGLPDQVNGEKARSAIEKSKKKK